MASLRCALTMQPLKSRDANQMLAQAMQCWGGHQDLWFFGYATLIWRPEFQFSECRPARVHGWHRALKMWSTVNRGTLQCPGLVFGMLPGGSCHGIVFRIPRDAGTMVLHRLWEREMPNAVYDPRWLRCQTAEGAVQALAFTLSPHSPHHTGNLAAEDYRHIFSQARGRYGSTLDYAQTTHDALQRQGIDDQALKRLLSYADPTAI